MFQVKTSKHIHVKITLTVTKEAVKLKNCQMKQFSSVVAQIEQF